MRLSANKNSKYYDEDLVSKVKVYLDGKYIVDATEADDIEGWVEYLKKDENGSIYTVYADGTRAKRDGYEILKSGENALEIFIAREILHGKVEIKFEEK